MPYVSLTRCIMTELVGRSKENAETCVATGVARKTLFPSQRLKPRKKAFNMQHFVGFA